MESVYILKKTEYEILRTFFQELQEELESLKNDQTNATEVITDLLEELHSVDKEIFHEEMINICDPNGTDVNDQIKQHTKIQRSSTIIVDSTKGE